MDQEGDSLDDREPTLLSHLLQYLIGLITFGVGHFSLGGRQPPVRLLVCNTSAANLLGACDVSALASHGQCRRGLGDFRHPCGAVSNAGEPMSCGRTVRSFVRSQQKQHQSCRHAVLFNKADSGLPYACGDP